MIPWRRNIFAIATASFIGFTGFTLVMPFLPLYLQQLGVTDVGEVALWSGLSLGVTPAMTAMLAPPWGRLSDRVGRKIMVERSLVSFIFVMTGLAYVTEAWQVFALRAVQGLFAGYGALAITMATESAPRDRTAYAIGIVQTAQRLGPALGPVIGGLIAQLVGLRATFLITALFYVFALLLLFFTYDETLTHQAGVVRRIERVRFRSVLAFENFVLLMAVVFGLQFVERSFSPILPLYVAELGVEPSRVPLIAGLLFSITAAAGAVGNHLCARLLRHGSPRSVIAGGAAAGAVATLLYAAAPQLWWLLVATPLFGIAMGVAITTTYTAASAVMPSNARGAGFGLLSSASLTGVALSPVVAGIMGSTSIRAVFILDLFALMALAVLVARLMVIVPREQPTTPVVEDV